MKNFLNRALALLLITFVAHQTQAQEIKLPPKPYFGIKDIGGYFTDTLEFQLVQYSFRDYNNPTLGFLKHEPVYVLTVPADYLPFLEAYARFVADNWGICGTDSCILAVITAETHPKAVILAGKSNTHLTSDTMCAFMASKILPDYIENNYSWDAFKDFLQDFDLSPSYTKSLFDGKGYQDFCKHYNPKITLARRAEIDAASTATIKNVLKWGFVALIAGIALYYFSKLVKINRPAAGPMYHRPTPQPPVRHRPQRH